jgi:hypothetical protein
MGDLAKEFVIHGMAIGIVHVLEPIEIQGKDRVLLPMARQVLGCLGQAFAKGGSVRKPREIIMRGTVGQAALGAMQGHDGLGSMTTCLDMAVPVKQEQTTDDLVADISMQQTASGKGGQNDAAGADRGLGPTGNPR